MHDRSIRDHWERSSWRSKRRRDERSEGGIGEEEATFQIFASLKQLD
jgi:hypothetical protein